MYIILHNTRHSFEFLPSISVHNALNGRFIFFIAWFTFALEIGSEGQKE